MHKHKECMTNQIKELKNYTKKLPQKNVDLFLQISKLIQEQEDHHTTLTNIVDQIIQFTGADEGYLFLKEKNGLIPFILRNSRLTKISPTKLKVPLKLINQSLDDKRAYLIRDVQNDERLEDKLSVSAFHIHSIMCVPISVHGKTQSVLYLQRIKNRMPFQHDHLDWVKAVVFSIGLLLENAELKELTLEKGRMQREMQMARDVQSSLIPQNVPQHSGWDGAFCWMPAFEVGGDYFDFISIDDHTLGLVIADVSDKGMPAALFMALSRTILRAVIGNHTDAASVIKRANQLIHHDAKEGMFITLFFAVLDLNTGELIYVNGGHNPPLFFRREHQDLIELQPTGMAVGIEAGAVYTQKKIKLEKGDFIFLYTDGALDATVRGKKFNEKELNEFIYRHRNADPERILSLLKENLCGMNSSASSKDDLTMIVWKRTADGEKDHL